MRDTGGSTGVDAEGGKRSGDPAPAGSRASRGVTRHGHIVEDIRSHIVDGSWPPGHQLPIETELAGHYGVSRMTVNKALAELAREGFLVRRKKSGTQVARPRAQSVVMAIADIREEVRISGRGHSFRLLERRMGPATEQDVLLLGDPVGGGDVLWLEGLHLADGRPFCLETRIINPAVAEGAAGQDFTCTAPGAWLLEAVPWTVASHRVRAVNARPSDARLLQLVVGEACLEIVRRTQVGGEWVTGVRLLYPGSDHQLVANFGPRTVEVAPEG